jgi:hypothetical protein
LTGLAMFFAEYRCGEALKWLFGRCILQMN